MGGRASRALSRQKACHHRRETALVGLQTNQSCCGNMISTISVFIPHSMQRVHTRVDTSRLVGIMQSADGRGQHPPRIGRRLAEQHPPWDGANIKSSRWGNFHSG
jgi:hypothetical protein